MIIFEPRCKRFVLFSKVSRHSLQTSARRVDILTQQVEQCKSFYTGNAFGLGRLPNMPEPPTDITFKQAVCTNDFIYFIGGYTFTTNIVGVFNRKTCNIDWQKSINLLETDNLKDIQYANNKIYVLDTGNQLHIFEKEE